MSALKEAPISGDPLFATIRRAKAGSPLLVSTPGGEPAFWLVPFLVQAKVCGLAEVALSGQVSRVSVLGSASEDQQSWIDEAFFAQPPERVLAEIRVRYEGASMTAPRLSYDASPSRWAWRVDASDQGGAPASTIFITPAGWYERRPDAPRGDREG